MLVHRLRRWPTIEPAMGRCLVFAGLALSNAIYPGFMQCEPLHRTCYASRHIPIQTGDHTTSCNVCSKLGDRHRMAQQLL